MFVVHRQGIIRGFYTGNTLCIPCANARFRGYFPWQGQGGLPMRAYHHRCRRCRRPFYGALMRRYCSELCGEATRNARRDRTRDRTARSCEDCGDRFTPPRSDGQYCSSACRQRAYRKRQAS